MFHLHLSSDNQFYFTLRARNGRVLMTSETYKSKAMAKRGIASVEKLFGTWLTTKDHTIKSAKRTVVFVNDRPIVVTERTVNGKLKVVRVGK